MTHAVLDYRRSLRLRYAPVLLALGLSPAGCAPEGEQGFDTPRGPLGKADAAGSCAMGDDDACGGKSDGACWCDDLCHTFGDCCTDKVETCGAPSCAGACGGQSPDGCWCDDLCEAYGDCCLDKAPECDGTPVSFQVEQDGTDLTGLRLALVYQQTSLRSDGGGPPINTITPRRVLQDLGEIPGPNFERLIPDPPPEAIGPITCDEAGWTSQITGEVSSPCVDNNTDRIAIGRFFLYQDNNGNGAPDEVSEDDPAFVDDIVTDPWNDDLVWLETFDNELIRSTHQFGGGLGTYPDAVFASPGFHLVDRSHSASAQCSECLFDNIGVCIDAWVGCFIGGGAPDACNEQSSVCQSVMPAQCESTCINDADQPGDFVTLSIAQTDRDRVGANIRQTCVEWVSRSHGPSHEDIGLAINDPASTCSDNGDTYDLVIQTPHNPNDGELCFTGVEARFDALPLPIEGPVPDDWPCQVNVSFLGEACDGPGSPPCHVHLDCDPQTSVCVE